MTLLSKDSGLRKIIERETNHLAVGYYIPEKLELMVIYNNSTSRQRMILKNLLLNYIDNNNLQRSIERISISYEVDDKLRTIFRDGTVSAR